MTVLSAETVGGSRDDVKQIAVAVELLHTATLVHDDILDADVMRRGELAVHRKWSTGSAILVGDILLATAVDLSINYGDQILRLISRTGSTLCEGEYMDLVTAEIDMSEETYMETITKKSASLFKLATQCGALASSASKNEVEALTNFGEHFGTAYQIRDDLDDMTSFRDDIPLDLKNLKNTLPMRIFHKNASEKDRASMLFETDILAESDDINGHSIAEGIVERLEKSGSLEYCKKAVNSLVRQATLDIGCLTDSNQKQSMISLAESLKL